VPVSLLRSLKPWIGAAKLAAVADITLAGEKFKAPSRAAVAGEMFPSGFGYDTELQRMKSEWMKQKWEIEQTERESERQRLAEKEEADRREREAERQRVTEKEEADGRERAAERKRLEEKVNKDREYERQMMELRREDLEGRRRWESKEEA
jgi:hypothetical protein